MNSIFKTSMVRRGWGATGNSGREWTRGCLLQKIFANIHTTKMISAMRGHFKPHMLGSGCPPPLQLAPDPARPRPPSLKLAGKWEGVGVWPLLPPPPPG